MSPYKVAGFSIQTCRLAGSSFLLSFWDEETYLPVLFVCEALGREIPAPKLKLRIA